MTPLAMSVLADEHIRDLRAAATHSRLVALARCCEGASWRRAATGARTAVTAWARRGQLGSTATYCSCP